jgi:ABC-2 type transport system ATP-binding protein
MWMKLTSFSDSISVIDHGQVIVSSKPWELKNVRVKNLIYLETSANSEAGKMLKKLGSVKGIKEKKKGIVVIVNVDGTYLLPEIVDKLRTQWDCHKGR